MKNILIIGGGPSGMMAAISAKIHHPNANITLLERNKTLGKKLSLTGGGRCNVSANVVNQTVVDNVIKNGRFLYSSLENFGPQEIIKFFNDHGCPLVEEDHHRMFPSSNKSKDIINTLKSVLLQNNIVIEYDVFVNKITKDTVYSDTKSFHYDHLILATGSKALKGSGSDGNGYNLAKTLGHTITDLYPAEVPLVSNDTVIQDKILQGLSFNDINIKVLGPKGKIVRSITHDLLFTHFGLSGPAALRASYDVINILKTNKTVRILIDFLPEIKVNDLNDDHINTLPKRLINYLNTLDYPLTHSIKHFEMTVYDTRGFSHAFVTNGGVNIKEIDPKTMRSKRIDSVSFCGELIDYNAYTGGYNITAAFSSGYTAGKYALKKLP